MARPLPNWLKWVHGSGAVAFGVKDNGFSVFLLIFYNQVLGMRADLVSLALAMALVIDAFVDPMIGNLSDRTYTRWGRRLPWLYAAALPLAIAWAVLWMPPAGAASFWGLLAIAVIVRLLLSACEVPSVALLPELTRDYDERTTLFRYRYLFGWLGGLGMMLLAYMVFLPGDEMLQREGYVSFGIVGAALIFLSVVGSAMGQHKLVAHRPQTKPPRFSLATAFSEIREAFSQRAFLILAAGGAAAYISQGVTFAISNYLFLFVWEFTSTAFFFYPLLLFASVVIVFLTLSPLHRRYGKARTAAVAAIVSMGFWLVPYGLRLAGAWPEVGGTTSTVLLFFFVLISNAAGVMVMISGSSMVAEIVEAFEEKTGRRAEGSFYSGNWFIQKCATGAGILLTGLIVSASGMPDGAEPGQVAEEVIVSMILLYCACVIVLGLVAAFWFARFPIGREEHEKRLRALDAAARGDIDATGVLP